MKTMTLEAEVTENGYVHLDIPVDLPAGKIELVLVMQPAANGIKQNGVHKPLAKSRQEIFDEIERLLRLGLGGVTWEEIKEGRRDDSQQVIADEIVKLLEPLKGVTLQEIKEDRQKMNPVLVTPPAVNAANPNGDHVSVQKSQQQLWNEFGQLTHFVFKDMTQEEITMGRKDDENRY